MTPKQARTILTDLFRGYTDHLVRAIADTKDNEQARIVAHRHITPILDALSDNAGQPMDAAYIAYLIQYAHGTH
jgi:hypothetical protein